MQIAGYLKTSLLEWPGKIAAVIFTPGCNFACPFCHNADLVDPKKIARLPKLNEEEILADLGARKKWIDGVVITGGEPTLQPNLPQFLKKLKNSGFQTMIETNGSQLGVLKRLLAQKLINALKMDYKVDFGRYASVVSSQPSVGVKVKNSIRWLVRSGLPFELRTTVVPTIHNGKVLLQMSQDLKIIAPQARWVLQSFQAKNCLDPDFNKLEPYPPQEMEKFKQRLKEIIPGVDLG